MPNLYNNQIKLLKEIKKITNKFHKKKFNAFIKELMDKLHVDQIQDIGTLEIAQTHPQINNNFGELAGL